MAGRGRAATLPAWMTSGVTETPAAKEPEIAPNSTPQSSASILNALHAISNSLIQPQSAPAITPTSSFSLPTSTVLPAQAQPRPLGPPAISAFPRPQFNPPPTFPAAVASTPTAQYGGGYAPQTYPGGIYPFPNATPSSAVPYGGFPASSVGMYPMNPMMGGPGSLIPPFNMRSVPPIAPPRGTTTTAMDPNNDKSAWSAHDAPDGRKYWFNKITNLSTYDKPLCLKTPEERSIPPCPWKEFIADGKKYYNNGVESVWDMPEEFRIWKEKMDAAAANAVNAVSNANNTKSSVSSNGDSIKTSTASATASVSTEIGGILPTSEEHSSGAGHVNGREKESAPVVPIVTYASKEEANAAFATMLDELRVTTSMKFKDAQDLCQDDQRWNALKTSGEKKQALAEYQTRRLRLEKDALKQKARKNRDAFLLMLAEAVEIDVRTRWRDAQTLLQNDSRFKNVDDSREREELFNDFILELEKKEKEDRKAVRQKAIAFLTDCFQRLSARKEITRKSTWAEWKNQLVEMITSVPELRSMDEHDLRTAFNDHIDKLEAEYRQQQRERKSEFQAIVTATGVGFRALLESLAAEGNINEDTKWKECVELPQIVENESFIALNRLFEDGRNSDIISSVIGSPSQLFSEVQQRVVECRRHDRRILRDLMDDARFTIYHDTQFKEFRALVCRYAGLKDNAEGSSFVTEDGEEAEGPSGGPFDLVQKDLPHANYLLLSLRTILLRRPASLVALFKEWHQVAVEKYEDELRRVARREERFVNLLEEYFYRSDHVGVSWDDAKQKLYKHSAYDALDKVDRKRLYTDYMAALAKKMNAKTESMKAALQQSIIEDAVSDELVRTSPTGERDKGTDSAAANGDVVDDDDSDESSDSDTESSSSHHKNKRGSESERDRHKKSKKQKKDKSRDKKKKHKRDFEHDEHDESRQSKKRR